MAEHGAKNIILASRSGKTQSDTMELVQRLSLDGVRVEVCQCDVADEAEVNRLISDCEKDMPPIRGIIHGAYVNKVCLHSSLKTPTTDSPRDRTSSSKRPHFSIGTP